MSTSSRSNTGSCPFLLLLLVAGLWAPRGAAAQTLDSVTPGKVSAGTSSSITVFGSGFGTIADLVEFPGEKYASPISYGPGWLTVVVPATWSGSIRVWSASTLSFSNSIDLEISFSWSETKWNATDLPLPWKMNQNGAPGCSVAATQDALVASYDTWECASGLTTSYQGTTTLLANNQNDGVNVHGWQNFGWVSGKVAVTSWRYNATTGDILEFDVNYNSQDFAWGCGDPTKMDVQNVATHEDGHTLGLWDLYGAADFDDTMYGFTSAGETLRRSLSLDDVRAAEFLHWHPGRANMTFGAPAGWHGTLSPRSAADATSTSAPLPALLTGNTTTYVSVGGRNAGMDCASPGAVQQLFLDGEFRRWLSWSGVWATGATYGLWPNQPVVVRGGRHGLAVTYDVDDTIVEADEFDNSYDEQFVWTPYVLTDLVPIQRDAPPDAGFFAAPNCDGFEFTTGWWGAFAVMPTDPGDDYDAYLYDDDSQSQSGFSIPFETSFTGFGGCDFVLVNGNNAGFGHTFHGASVRYSASTVAAAIVQQSNEVGTLVPTNVYGEEVSSGLVTLGALDILRVHEVYLDASCTYRFELDNLSGSANLNMTLYPTNGAYHGKWDFAVGSLGGGADEYFEYQPPANGYVAVVVWKNDAVDVGLENTYELTVGTALSNLSQSTAPEGWFASIVPRPAADGLSNSVPFPTELVGNDTATFFNLSTHQQGPFEMPAWSTEVWLDDALVGVASVPDDNVPGYWVSLNGWPTTVRGGRHAVTAIADPAEEVAETNELDNYYGLQLTWSPLALTKNDPLDRGRPPWAGLYPSPNCDGMEFVPAVDRAWAIGMAPRGIDDHDLLVYDDPYSGPVTGFSNEIGSSMLGPGATDIVVGSTSGILYPAVVNFYASFGNGFLLNASDSQGHQAGEVGSFESTLAEKQVVDVYEAQLRGGEAYAVRLRQHGGTANLSVAVFPTTGVYGLADAIAVGAEEAPGEAHLTFVPAADGAYPVAVFREGGVDASVCDYHLSWIADEATPVEQETATSFAFQAAYPNPSPGYTTMAFSIPKAGSVTLAVYDVRGRHVQTLLSGALPAGRHEVAWDGRDGRGRAVASGSYWVRLEAGHQAAVRRLSILQ